MKRKRQTKWFNFWYKYHYSKSATNAEQGYYLLRQERLLYLFAIFAIIFAIFV